eukprot:2579928-Pyramimonas_sp.AAC.1
MESSSFVPCMYILLRRAVRHCWKNQSAEVSMMFMQCVCTDRATRLRRIAACRASTPAMSR